MELLGYWDKLQVHKFFSVLLQVQRRGSVQEGLCGGEREGARPSAAAPLNAPPLSSLLWGGKRGCSPLRCRPPSTPLPLLPSVLQENKFWEDSFQVYERGVALFKYPHVKEIWQAYLKHFVER